MMRIGVVFLMIFACWSLYADLAPSQETAGSGALTKTEKLKRLQSNRCWQEAEKILKAKGVKQSEVAKVLEEMPDRQLQTLLAMAELPQKGGFLDLLLFVLVVALIVWLILILLDPWYWRYRY